MSDFKTSGCEAPKTGEAPDKGFENLLGQRIGKLADLYGVDYPEKLTLRYEDSNCYSWEDNSRIVLECKEITFLTDCAKISLKRDDLSRFVDRTRRIVINGVSFVKEDGSGDGE